MSVRRILVAIGVFAAIQVAAYAIFFRGQLGDIDRTRERIEGAKIVYAVKKNQAVNLDLYRRQLRDLDDLFGRMLEALPDFNKAPFGDVINAAQTRGLHIDLQIAKSERYRDSYAESEAGFEVHGFFHQIAAFVADLVQLPASVVLDSFVVERSSTPGVVNMKGVVRTFRYVHKEEMDDYRKATAASGKEKTK